MGAIAPARTDDFRQTQLLSALRALRRGQFNHRLPSDLTGVDGEIAEAFNDVMELNDGLARELARMRRAVGREGRFAERASLPGATGRWQHCIDSVNELVEEIVQSTAEVARVMSAVAKGDRSQAMETSVAGRPLKGEFLRIARTANTMVERLGLSLSTIYGFIRQSNGGVSIESETGPETTIRFYLPRADAVGVEPASPAIAGPVSPSAGTKVLVVDDDQEVRAVAVALLRDLGYAVVEAGDGHAGLALLKADATISLLFTDWAMPGMDGCQLATRAAEIRPCLPVLFTSGNANEFFAGPHTPADAHFLAKPYRQHDLAEAVGAAIAQRHSG